MDNIYGLEKMPSVHIREVKSGLELVELRAKTANISRSLPDWVRNGILPPSNNNPPPANVISDRRDNDAHGDAVQISCEMRAHLGFLMSSEQLRLPPVASNPHTLALLISNKGRYSA